MSIFPFNSNSNSNLINNKNTSNIKNFFTDLLNALANQDNCDVENVTGIDWKYYHSEESAKQFSGSKCFSAFHLNIASLSKHFDELQTLLSLLVVNFRVIGITESKFLKDTQPAINFSLQNYSAEP